MKKAKLRTGTASSKPTLAAKAALRKPMNLVDIRRQIADLVTQGALGMVETTMEEVGKGHYLGMKYLFEMVGLYPATSTDDTQMQDSLAATLLRRLGLPETTLSETKVTKDPGTTVVVSEDVLE